MTKKRNRNSLKHKYPKEYRSWCGMKTRCYNKNYPSYKDYGGRGFVVCDEWINDFDVFIHDMGPKPEGRKYSLDRVNNNKGYSPDNCRWADDKMQANNRRNNRVIKWNNKEYSLSGFSDFLGIHSWVVKSRLKSGWSLDKIVSTPVKKYKNRTNKK